MWLDVSVLSSIGCYGGALGGYLYRRHLTPMTMGLAGTGFLLHAYLIYGWIDGGRGQNLTFFYWLTQIAWCTVWLSALMNIKGQWAGLLSTSFLFAGVSIVLARLFPGDQARLLIENPDVLWHVLLVMFLTSTAMVTLMLASLMVMGTWLLKHKQGLWWVQRLPPLDRSQQWCFRMIKITTVMMWMVVVTSFYMFFERDWRDFYGKLLLCVLFLVIYLWLWWAWQQRKVSREKLAVVAGLTSTVLLFIHVVST